MPVDLIKQDLVSSSYMVGNMIRTTYELSEQLFLNLNYMLSYMNGHTTTIQSISQNGNINHKLSHSFNFGVRYFF